MTDKTESDHAAEGPDGERIAKVMARAGLCSRRDAERWIADGRVAVNGERLDSPAFNVTEGDKVTVDGRPISRRERTRLFLFHKPRGTVTTDRDPEGRPTIFDVLPQDLPRLVTIGRLDINTEGLLLLTNDGGLARVLELPATGWLRRYRVRAHGEVTQPQLDALAEGVTIEGVEYRGIEANLDRVQGANVWITMGLREGKNREIKRVLEHLGLSVNRLIRLSYGPFQLLDLPEGAVEEVKTRVLMDQLGDKLATEANADFEAPVYDRKDLEKMAKRHHADDEPEREERSPKGGARAKAGGRDAPRARSDERPARKGERREQPSSGANTDKVKRKHVSVLRTERDDESGPRKKVERSETADRNGRKVSVERVASTAPEAGEAQSRNGRKFARERRGDEEPQRERRSDDRQAGGDRPPMRRRDGAGGREGFAPRGEASGERRPREAGAFGRRDDAPRPERKGDRAPRRGGDDGKLFVKREGGRPEGRSFGDRPPRREGGEGRPFVKREGARPEGRSFEGRPPRREGGEARPFVKREGARPEGRSFEGRPPRREGGEGRPFVKREGARPEGRSFEGRPPRREAGEGRPFVKREGARPEGRSFEGRPPRREGGEGRPFVKREGARPEGRSFEGRPPRREGGEGRPFVKREGARPEGRGREDRGGDARPPRKAFGTEGPMRKGPPRNEGGGKPGGRFGDKPGGGRSGGGKPGYSKPGTGRTGGGGGGKFGSGGKPGGRHGGRPANRGPR